jgi:hypothetical protein
MKCQKYFLIIMSPCTFFKNSFLWAAV